MNLLATNWASLDHVIQDVEGRAKPLYVCLLNVHSVITANKDQSLSQALQHAAFVLPDGAPVAWLSGLLNKVKQPRLSGPELMLRLCEVAAAKNKRVYFYGSSDDVLAKLKQKLLEAYPTLQIVGMHSPEYKADVQTETVSKIAEINALKPDYIFVGLGCPKQEIWMYRHANLFPDSVLLGVGAAFNFHAGTVKRAPEWMRNSGLEWLFRLIQEPRRLWKRYLVTNTLFIAYAIRVLIRFYLFGNKV